MAKYPNEKSLFKAKVQKNSDIILERGLFTTLNAEQFSLFIPYLMQNARKNGYKVYEAVNRWVSVNPQARAVYVFQLTQKVEECLNEEAEHACVGVDYVLLEWTRMP